MNQRKKANLQNDKLAISGIKDLEKRTESRMLVIACLYEQQMFSLASLPRKDIEDFVSIRSRTRNHRPHLSV
jgi:hypothetical protein